MFGFGLVSAKVNALDPGLTFTKASASASACACACAFSYGNNKNHGVWIKHWD